MQSGSQSWSFDPDHVGKAGIEFPPAERAPDAGKGAAAIDESLRRAPAIRRIADLARRGPRIAFLQLAAFDGAGIAVKDQGTGGAQILRRLPCGRRGLGRLGL